MNQALNIEASKGGDLSLVDLIVYFAFSLLGLSLLVYNGLDNKKRVVTYVSYDQYRVAEASIADNIPLENLVMRESAPIDPVRAPTLDLPVKSMSEITAWASNVAVGLFSVDFMNYFQQVSEMRPFFTESGWAAMNTAMRDSGWVSSLIESKLRCTSVLSGPPIVVNHGIRGDAYAWVINFPLLVTYESASERRKETRVFTLAVKRIAADFDKGQAGIAIDSFITSAESGLL